MSAGDNYYTAPLSILRSGKSHLEVLEAVLAWGIVNAGIAYRKKHGEEAFEQLLEDADDKAVKENAPSQPPKKLFLRGARGSLIVGGDAVTYWKYAHAGWKLLGIRGGDRARDAQIWLDNPWVEGRPFFTMRSDWVWGALNQARHEAGGGDAPERPLDWREFRILAAILSGKANSYGFCFLGWECIQARSCGHHTKELFRNDPEFPAHCQPLTRSMIRATCEKLEALGFFARVRYSRGKSGGWMAYSFRHQDRASLIESVKKWDRTNRSLSTKVADLRAQDRAAFADNQVLANQSPTTSPT